MQSHSDPNPGTCVALISEHIQPLLGWSHLCLSGCWALIIAKRLTHLPLLTAQRITLAQWKNLWGAGSGRLRAQAGEKRLLSSCVINGPKCPISQRGVPLPRMPHLIIQTAELWRVCGVVVVELLLLRTTVGEKKRKKNNPCCNSSHGSVYSWKMVWASCLLSSSLPPPAPPTPCALSPILISRGASWRGSRTAAQLAARRLFISSASRSSLPVCLPASTTNSQMQRDSLSERLDSVQRVLLFILYPHYTP